MKKRLPPYFIGRQPFFTCKQAWGDEGVRLLFPVENTLEIGSGGCGIVIMVRLVSLKAESVAL